MLKLEKRSADLEQRALFNSAPRNLEESNKIAKINLALQLKHVVTVISEGKTHERLFDTAAEAEAEMNRLMAPFRGVAHDIFISSNRQFPEKLFSAFIYRYYKVRIRVGCDKFVVNVIDDDFEIDNIDRFLKAVLQCKAACFYEIVPSIGPLAEPPMNSDHAIALARLHFPFR